MIRTVISMLEPGFGVRLWTGEHIGPATGPTLLINDPSLLRQLILRPKLDTIVEAWIAKSIDVENGTLFDIVALRPQGKLKQQLKQLPKWQFLKEIPSLLLSGKSGVSSGLAGSNPYKSGSDKDAITHHYDVSNAFYQTFLDQRMVYTCAYFRDWNNSIDQAQEDKLELICRKLRLCRAIPVSGTKFGPLRDLTPRMIGFFVPGPEPLSLDGHQLTSFRAPEFMPYAT